MDKDKLQYRAFDIFRNFTITVKEQEDIAIEIKDESVLVNDLMKAISSAKKALTIKEKKVDREIEGYDIGFMLGFIRGKLNSIWVNEYLIKQTNAYKEYMAIKAIKLFLLSNEITKIQITHLHNQLFSNALNLTNTEPDIAPVKIGNNELDSSKMEIDENQIIQTLENKINEYIRGYLSKSQPEYVGEMGKYFSAGEILFFIKNDLEF